jgi:prepilin-type N-terminal cleavage/methylation domain-containing protein
MKRKLPTPHRRLPIDFGDEFLCLIPVRKSAVPLRDSRRIAVSVQVNGNHPTASPSPGGEGWGEGELNNNHGGAGVLASRLRVSLKHKAQNPKLRRRGFTLVEIIVVLALLSLITYALMAVFSSTQRAFRAGITQTDSLESGRAVMDLIAGDLETMTPSYGMYTNTGVVGPFYPVNFISTVKTTFAFSDPPSPLYQSLVGSPDGATRTNILEDIFILSKGSINGVPSWIATGYSVNTNLPDGTLYPLYRFYLTTNASSGFNGEYGLYAAFQPLHYTNSAVWSHLMDGVVNLTARAYDTNGVWMTNGYYNGISLPVIPVQTVFFVQSVYGEVGCAFYSNAVPASVQIVLGTLEDRTLEHAEGLTGINQSNYLANQAGQVHLFTRRVWIRNVDPTAYQ